MEKGLSWQRTACMTYPPFNEESSEDELLDADVLVDTEALSVEE